MARVTRDGPAADFLGRTALLFAVLTWAFPTTASTLCIDDGGHRYAFAQAPATVPDGLRCVDAAPHRSAAAAVGPLEAVRVDPPPAQPRSASGLLALDPRPLPLEGMRLIWPAISRGRVHPIDPAMRALIAEIAGEFGHDVRLLNAIVQVESNFDPTAVSPKGAIGLMQLMPATAQRMGVADPSRALFDPVINLRAGARYLRFLMNIFPDRLPLAIAAYNAGEDAVRRRGGSIPPYPETQAYVRDVLAAMQP